MSDNTSLVNIGELSKPATVLIEKISDAVGGIFEPHQIRRVARAKADANIIIAKSKIKITNLEQRALARFLTEEAKKQNNIEAITASALPQLEENAKPEKIEDDWIVNFFDKCRLISDDEMQLLWSKILAGEANSPGRYSKRTIGFLSTLDKFDAKLFQSLIRYAWDVDNLVVPLIYDTHDPIYIKNSIHFISLKHLDEIGLISFDPKGEYSRLNIPKKLRIFYYGKPVDIEFENETDNKLLVGHVMLSKIGQELALICDNKPIRKYFDYVIKYWTTKKGLCISSP
jgi:hypothetical protein